MYFVYSSGKTNFNSLKMWDEIPRNNWLLNLCVMKSNSCVSEERNLYLYLPEGQFFLIKKGIFL